VLADKDKPMSDDLNKRLATLNALLELKEAVARDDFEAAQDCRDKRLILALDLFSTDRKRHDALQQVFDVTAGWVRGLGSADTVVEALKRAIPLFEH
jgi:hypothetical protein